MLVYMLKSPWIEQYKSLPNEPWPWADPAFNKQMWKGIWGFIVNVYLVNPCCFIFTIYMNNWKLITNFDPAGLPDAYTLVK